MANAELLNDVRAMQEHVKKTRAYYTLKGVILRVVMTELLAWGKKAINKSFATKVEVKLPAGLRMYYHHSKETWGVTTELRVWGEVEDAVITYNSRMVINLLSSHSQSATEVIEESATQRMGKQIAFINEEIKAIDKVEASLPKAVASYNAAKNALSECRLLLEESPFRYMVPELP
jgi:arginine utilization protein RocB